MKNNSFTLRSMLSVLMAFMLMLVLFDACKKSDDPVVVPVDKTKLKARLDSAFAGLTLAVEGTQVGQFEAGSKAVFKSAVDAANTLYDNKNATQTEINNAYVNLGQAGVVFLSKQVQQIAPANLVLYLKMDGDAKDASGKGFNGMLKTGDTSGVVQTVLPVLAPDRYGVAGKAYSFSLGSNIEVPYNLALNPGKEITISLWAKPTKIFADNYMVALNRWNGYKMQLQSANKLFYTIKTTKGGYDKDNESPTLDVNKWYHLAVSFKSGQMTFYINGAPVKVYNTGVDGDPAASNSAINLTIGQDMPTASKNDVANPAAGVDNWYKKYGGYFNGSLDEVRIYNVVLNDAQVKSIYTAEKP